MPSLKAVKPHICLRAAPGAASDAYIPFSDGFWRVSRLVELPGPTPSQTCSGVSVSVIGTVFQKKVCA